MSRSGFHEMDEWDQDAILSMGRTAGRIASASRGRRGQAFLRLALDALDQMEDKRLAGGTFGVGSGGCMCLMTSIATETGHASALGRLHTGDDEGICDDMAGSFNIASVLVRDLVWINDECAPWQPAQRWEHMRRLIAGRIAENDAGEEM